MRRHTLTDLLITYRKSGQGRQELIDKTAVYIHTLASRKRDWDEDDVSEFFCYFYPKIPDLIDRFVYSGKPFESYLIAHVKWNLRGFSVKLKKRRWREELYCREEMWEIHENDPSYFPAPPRPPKWIYEEYDDGSSAVSSVWKQRLLFLCLRECEQLNNRLLERIAVMIDMPRDRLLDHIEQARAELEKGRCRIRTLTESRNQCYMRLQLLEHELCRSDDTARRTFLLERIDQEREMLRVRNERISRVRIRPSNRAIARILRVPKGSVDSGLHYLFYRLPGHIERKDKAA
jgi:hypothetical protein